MTLATSSLGALGVPRGQTMGEASRIVREPAAGVHLSVPSRPASTATGYRLIAA